MSDAKSILQNLAAEKPKTEPSGDSTVVSTPATGGVEGASERAVVEHFGLPSSEDMPKKRGRPRKNPVDSGGGIWQGANTPADVQPPPPAFDEKTIEPLVDGAIEMLNELAASITSSAVLKATGSEPAASEAASRARMGEKTALMIREGAMGCARKYSAHTQFAPEAALFGGLAIWCAGNFLALRVVKNSMIRQSP